MDEARSTGGKTRTLDRAAWALAAVCATGALIVGGYTVLAPLPECGGLYVCRRVLDRTLLLGWTSMAAAVVVAAVLMVMTRTRRRIGWPWRILLLAAACLLTGAYWKTHFGALRADLAAQMTVAAPMWTASVAFWLAVAGFVCAAAGGRPR